MDTALEIANNLPDEERFIALFMYHSGLRVREVFEVRLQDLDFNAGVFQVHGSKGRTIPMSRTFLLELKEYLAVGQAQKIFYTFWRDARYCPPPKTKTKINRFLKVLGQPSHLFRKTYARNLEAQGLDIKIISERLGIKSIQKTKNLLSP